MLSIDWVRDMVAPGYSTKCAFRISFDNRLMALDEFKLRCWKQLHRGFINSLAFGNT